VTEHRDTVSNHETTSSGYPLKQGTPVRQLSIHWEGTVSTCTSLRVDVISIMSSQETEILIIVGAESRGPRDESKSRSTPESCHSCTVADQATSSFEGFCILETSVGGLQGNIFLGEVGIGIFAVRWNCIAQCGTLGMEAESLTG
jgi:hypothetical protein